MGSAARTKLSYHSLGASSRPGSSRPLCRRSRPEAASGEPGALWWYALSLFCVSPTGSGAGDWGGLPGGRRRALASGGQARPRPLGPPSLLPAHRAPGPRPGGCGFCSGGGGSGGSGHGGRRRGRRGSRGLELPWPRSEQPLPQFPMLLPPQRLSFLLTPRCSWYSVGSFHPGLHQIPLSIFRPGVSLPSGHSPSAPHLVSPARQCFQLTRGAGKGWSLELEPF